MDGFYNSPVEAYGNFSGFKVPPAQLMGNVVNMGGFGYNNQMMNNEYNYNQTNNEYNQMNMNNNMGGYNYNQNNMGGYNYNNQNVNNGYYTNPINTQYNNNGYATNGQLVSPVNNMGGYYNNQYNNYFNPYLAQKQWEMQQVQMREQQRQQCELMKDLVRMNAHALGKVANEEYLEKTYVPEYEKQQPKMSEEEDITWRLLAINATAIDGNMILYNKRQRNCQIESEYQKRFPPDMKLADFLEEAGNYYRDMYYDDLRNKQRDLSQLYDHNEFQKLLKKYSGSNYFNSIANGIPNTGNVTIDDMEIKLPEYLNTNYMKRKQAFINSIMNNN